MVRDLFRTETTELADYVLPAASFLERSELHVYSQYQWLALSRKVLAVPGAVDEYSFWSELAQTSTGKLPLHLLYLPPFIVGEDDGLGGRTYGVERAINDHRAAAHSRSGAGNSSPKLDNDASLHGLLANQCSRCNY